MINWSIASRWQNWVIVFLMFYIAITGIHLAWSYIDIKRVERNKDE